MKNFRILLLGIIIGAFVFNAMPIAAAVQQYMLTKSEYKIVTDKATHPKELSDPNYPVLNYNGAIYVPLGKTMDLLNISYAVNKDDKEVIIQKPMSAPVELSKVTTNSPSKEVTIVGADFYNSGTTTLYTVVFSDHFSVSLGIPKSNLPSSLYETAIVRINTGKMDSTSKIKTPNIVGFSELHGEKYYPLAFSFYSEKMPTEEIKQEFKEFDFYELFKSYKQGDNIVGMLVYDSFPKLEGISYDDGVHNCNLYFEDKKR